MHLTQESLQRFCKDDPTTTEFVHIDGVHIDRMRPDSLLRCSCMVSLKLTHADLLTVEGKALAGCANLWWIDLSHNRLSASSLEDSGLSSFPALGLLNLSHNRLTPDSLGAISEVEVLQLSLSGNAELLGETYRATVMHRVPATWVLDEHFVTYDEHAAAARASRGQKRVL